MDKSRVDVVICDSNYVLSAEQSEERIKEIAKYVDNEIKKTSRVLNCNPNFKCAVLASLNIAEKLMNTSDMMLKLQTENYQLDSDVKHYISLWENAKKQVTDMKDRMSTEIDRKSQNDDDYNKLKEKLSLMESAYFDLQMENVNLKNELNSVKITNRDDE